MIEADVLSIGATSWDQTFLIDHHPGPDEKMIAQSFNSCGGGPAANAAVTVAKMGLKAVFIGYLGHDVYGQMHLKELLAAGVNTDFIVRGNEPTPVSSILIKPGGERSLVNYRANRSYLSFSRSDVSAIHPKVVLLDGHEPEAAEAFLKNYRDKKIISVLDAGSLHPGTEILFRRVDYLIASSKFAFEVTGKSDPEEAVTALSVYNSKTAITLGAAGLIWNISDETGRTEGIRADALDTTGAGDVFHGAFAGCLAMGWGWRESLKYANCAAALSCAKIGGRTSIPDKAEVSRFFRKYDQKS